VRFLIGSLGAAETLFGKIEKLASSELRLLCYEESSGNVAK
jgi:hypothetical protein